MNLKDKFKWAIDELSSQYPVKLDAFKPWHDYLRTIRTGLRTGEIKTSEELSDMDIAITFVVGIANDLGYEVVTSEMIYHLLKALTDVRVY